MKKFKIVKVEVWTYFVEAETKEEAEQKEKAGDYEYADQEAAVIISSEEVNETEDCMYCKEAEAIKIWDERNSK